MITKAYLSLSRCISRDARARANGIEIPSLNRLGRKMSVHNPHLWVVGHLCGFAEAVVTLGWLLRFISRWAHNVLRSWQKRRLAVILQVGP